MDGIVTLRVRARVLGEGPIEARLTNDRQTYRLPIEATFPVPIAKVSLVVENNTVPKGWEMVPEGLWEVVEIIEPDR